MKYVTRPALVIAVAIVAAAASSAGPAAQTSASQKSKTLDIYVADTEGGKAALFVTPAGEAVLIDSGNPGERDHGRIVSMLKDAGVSKLDYLISTHYHVDHIGGLTELAKVIPIAHYIDHGPNVEAKEQVPGFQEAYAELWKKAAHTVVKPGDKLALKGIDWTIVTSAGEAIKKPLPGGGRPNPVCATVEKRPEPANPDDNGQSVGSVITYGQFRAIDLGDLLWNEEVELMCPNNPIGTVDLYLATHHGLAQSGSDALVHGVRPRAAVMQNGTRKGGAVAALDILHKSPGLEDIWLLHWSHNGGIEHNPPGLFIANVDDPETIASVLTSPPGAGRGGGRGNAGGPPPSPAAPQGGAARTGGPGASSSAGAPPAGRGQGRGRGAAANAHTPAYYIKVSANADGTFTITNTRNGFSKTYGR